MKKIEEPTERPLTARERLELVLMGLAKDQAVAALCEEAGISRSLFYRWMAQVRRALSEALETKKRGRKAKSIIESPREVEALQDRLLELEREVAKLRKERDRFKLVTEVAQRVIHKNAWPSRGRRGRPKKIHEPQPTRAPATSEAGALAAPAPPPMPPPGASGAAPTGAGSTAGPAASAGGPASPPS